MERRAESRFTVNQPVTLTLLGERQESFSGTLGNLSGKGAQITAAIAPPVGTPVRITFADKLLLGEVCHVQQYDEGFTIGVQLETSLTSLTDLQRLVTAVMGVREGADEQRPAEVRRT